MKDSLSSKISLRSWRVLGWGVFVVVLLAAIGYSVVQPVLADAPQSVRLSVYAFSTQEEAFTQGIFPAFEEAWEAETGKDLEIEGVFGPSGALAGQIALGAPADVVVFSHSHHVTWLKYGRLVKRSSEPILIGATPVVIVARPGNPEGFAEFADLAHPDIALIHADPGSSGVGEWSVLAEYGSALMETGDPAAAEAQLEAIWDNVRVLAISARAAMTLFELGAGDAVITYEQDARLASQRGVPLEIILPKRTIVAQPVAVIVDANMTRAKRPVAQALIGYLDSPAGQQILRRYHLRPASGESPEFALLVDPFTVDDLGGWSYARREYVEKLWQTEIEPRLDIDTAPALLSP